MNYLETAVSDAGFTKLSSYGNVSNDVKSYIGLGGGGLVLGALGAPYAGQAATNITGMKSRMGGMLAKPRDLGSIPVPFSGGKRIPIGQIKTYSPKGGRLLGGKRLAAGLMGGKLLLDYAGGYSRGSISKGDLAAPVATGMMGAGIGASLTKSRLADMAIRPALRRGLRGALIGAALPVMYHYSKNKI